VLAIGGGVVVDVRQNNAVEGIHVDALFGEIGCKLLTRSLTHACTHMTMYTHTYNMTFFSLFQRGTA
jgi:hypothetical protein